ncbi:hypothetical protein ANTRET_LOCUS6789 [Anthophora retusa]
MAFRFGKVGWYPKKYMVELNFSAEQSRDENGSFSVKIGERDDDSDTNTFIVFVCNTAARPKLFFFSTIDPVKVVPVHVRYGGSRTEQQQRRRISSPSKMTSDERWRNGYGRSRCLTRGRSREGDGDDDDLKAGNATWTRSNEKEEFLFQGLLFVGWFPKDEEKL